MCISNGDTQHYPFCWLELVVKSETFEWTLHLMNPIHHQNSLKSPKLLRQRIRKRYYKTLGTRVINSLSLGFGYALHITKSLVGGNIDCLF